MEDIIPTQRLNSIIQDSVSYCKKHRHEFITPEHMLDALLRNDTFCETLDYYCDMYTLFKELHQQIDGMERVPDDVDYQLMPSEAYKLMIGYATEQVVSSSAPALDIPHIVKAMLRLEGTWCSYLLNKNLSDSSAEFMSQLISAYEEDDDVLPDDDELGAAPASNGWRKLVTCLQDVLSQHNPLIGREAELERTIQVLCRREKNNPLHVGEPGVGKTALVYGLAARIQEGRVPPRLQGCKIYQLDLGTLLAGTQFRGDFENRIKEVMDGVRREGSAIVYIDEIHNLVGAGAVGESSMDASNMLKPYLEKGDIHFIGSTTYEEYNRYFSRSKGLVRRFQQIDILEPSIDETLNILRQLKPQYEAFHGVTYDDDALQFAVEASARYINDRFLPDKAIDLIDEAGAAMELRPTPPADATTESAAAATTTESTDAATTTEPAKAVVTRAHIADVLAKTCKVDSMSMKDDDTEQLATLYSRMQSQIYGQDEAIQQVVEAVQMSKAGLLDDQKPLASLLFVGPTGVGKTEVARVLARELGIELVRFDMSEYTEKHTVAKLIGSPAGYVGYDDGGLLTDAIRKTPNCVLLLDEIEKAHEDIYNILLQVMDYASLADNKGRRADFRNVVLIMTSNAGAQYAGMSVGFDSSGSRGGDMLKQVKKTFKPEFINRLSNIVVFNDMDETMAGMILDKKLRELQAKLAAKKVTLKVSAEARAWLLKEGFTAEYGARELDRVLHRELKTRLVREILFGTLKRGGTARVTLNDGSIVIK